jgi:pimeloyl-ACP methyl ester carboxylesterase
MRRWRRTRLTLALMTHLEIDRAVITGLSMGGYVARPSARGLGAPAGLVREYTSHARLRRSSWRRATIVALARRRAPAASRAR